MEYVYKIKWESECQGKIKWMTVKGKSVEADEVVAIVEANRQSVNIKATASGIVTQFCVPWGGSFNKGQVLCEINTCAHSHQISQMCIVCGANVGDFLKPAPLAVSKVHASMHGNDFQITQRSAEEKQVSFKKELMQQRKLYLILDLDSTILHASIAHDRETEDPQLNYFRCSGQKWKVKFRPGLAEFLEKVNQKFVIHIYTNAMKVYADHIVRLIKKRYGPQSIFPDGEIRVLSRDDTKDFVKRLSQILPNIDTYSLIVDDREDVWNTNLENVVPIHPYLFFEGAGDPNDPALFANLITPKRERDQEPVMPTREVKKQKVIEGPIKVMQVEMPAEIGIDESLYEGEGLQKYLEIFKEREREREKLRRENPKVATASNVLFPRGKLNNNANPKLPQSVSTGPRNNSLTSPMALSLFELPSLKKNDSPMAIEQSMVAPPVLPASEVTGMELVLLQNSFGIKNLDIANADMVVERSAEDIAMECEPSPETKDDIVIASDLDLPASNAVSFGKVLFDDQEVDITDEEMAEEYERKMEAAILKEEDDRSDTHLTSVYQVLDDVHTAFFAEMDRTERAPDVRLLLRQRRKSTLAGCSLLFTGVIPNTSDPRTTREWIDAERFGAKCYLEKNKGITHIVAGKPGTDKVVNRTEQDCMFVVYREWMRDSIVRWSRQDERNYPLLDPAHGTTCQVFLGQPPRIIVPRPLELIELREKKSDASKVTELAPSNAIDLGGLLRKLQQTAGEFYAKPLVVGGTERMLKDTDWSNTRCNILEDLNADF